VADVAGDQWALDVIGLRALTERTAGRAEIAVALLDGPVALDHPDLAIPAFTADPVYRSAGGYASRAAGAPAAADELVPIYPIGLGTYQCGACTCFTGEECTVTPGGWCQCRAPGPYGLSDDLKTQPAEFLTG
jgi:hypothetical protein